MIETQSVKEKEPSIPNVEDESAEKATCSICMDIPGDRGELECVSGPPFFAGVEFCCQFWCDELQRVSV